MGMEVAPVIDDKPCPTAVSNEPLAAQQVVSAPLTGDFSVLVTLPIKLAELEKRTASLVGKPIGQSGVVPRRIALSTTAGRLVARITVDGPLVGDLILVGHPWVDVDNRLVLPDLVLDFESQSAVQRLRFRLASALDRHLANTVRKAAIVDFTSLLEDARQALDAPLMLGPQLQLRLWPSQVRIHRIVVGADALEVQFVVVGHGRLTTAKP